MAVSEHCSLYLTQEKTVMPNLNATTEQHIKHFLEDEAQRKTLTDEIMGLAEELADKRPDVIDDFVSSIILEGWTPAKAN